MIVEETAWISAVLWFIFSTFVIVKCSSKKKQPDAKIPQYKMAATPKNDDKTDNTPNKSPNKSKKEGGSPVAGKGGAAPAAIVPAINRGNLIPQVKDAAPTIKKAEGDDKKVVSNPIITNVTDEFPTVADKDKDTKAEDGKKLEKADGTQSEADETQKD